MGEIASPGAPDAGASRRARYARYVFWIMTIIGMLDYLDRYIFIGAADVIGKELHFNLSGIGYITSAFLVVLTLSAIPLGAWADRSSRKNIVALCVAIWSATTALTSLAINFGTLFVSRMILGIGQAGYFPAGTALLSDYYSREKRSRIMSWWSAGQLFGILGGYFIGGAVAGLYFGSWRLAFLITGIPGLALAYLMWRVREPRRNEADEESGTSPTEVLSEPEVLQAEEQTHAFVVPRGVFSQFLALLHVRTMVVLIVMQVFAYFVTGVSTTFLPTYMQQKDTFGLSSGLAGLYSGGIIVLAGVAGTIVGGYMADYLNRRHRGARVLVCGIGFLIGAPSFACAVLFHNLAIFTIFFITSAFLLTIYSGPSTAATQDVSPSVLRASAVSITILIAHLFGDAFAPSIVGVIATAFDPTHGMHFLTDTAGHDLSLALLVTGTPALLIAGLVGIFGSRWMASDVTAAEKADRLVKEAQAQVGPGY
jgi:MFS family permease